jgi:hypothetical protein
VNREKQINNPQKIFKEQNDLVVQKEKMPVERDDLTSIRRSDITSIVPDDINWSNIYVGKQHGVHSIKPDPNPKKE